MSKTTMSDAEFARKFSPEHIRCGERMDDLQAEIAARDERILLAEACADGMQQVARVFEQERDTLSARVRELEAALTRVHMLASAMNASHGYDMSVIEQAIEASEAPATTEPVPDVAALERD